MEESGLLLLPDDALLAVLAYVAPRQLMKLRVMCRRLRDICLHADLWRSVHLEEYSEGRLVLLAALRLVPCLGGVQLFGGLLPRMVSEISTFTCVVAHLKLDVSYEADLVSFATIVDSLASLGGITALHLNIFFQVRLEPLPALLKMLCRTEQLRELQLNFAETPLIAPWRDLKGTASLKRLKFYGEEYDGELLESLLRTHATTLEIVDLFNCRLPSSLKDLRQLQSLAFHLEDFRGQKKDLSVLAEIADLEILHIRGSGTHCPPEVLDLLRRSSRLRSVTMPLPTMNPTAPVLALAASPAARVLQTLVMSDLATWDDSYQKMPEALAAALPLFSSLQDLDLGMVSPAIFQRVVSSTLSPSLKTLRVSDNHCAHRSLHDVNVQNLLAGNPQLHFWPGLGPGMINSEFCDCQWCESGCHKELDRFKYGEGHMDVERLMCMYGEGLALASHEKRIGCPADCFQLHG